MNQKEHAARLLRGENTPSVIERERMAKEILKHAGAKRPARTGLWIGLGGAGVAGVLALLLLVSPSELTPRGTSGGAVLEALCQPGPACRSGSRLLLRVSNHDQNRAHAAAFTLTDTGTVIWYFPDEGGSTIPFQDGQWMQRGVLLGEEHLPGDYEVYVVITPISVDRQSVRSFVEEGGDDRFLLLSTKVTVVP